RAGRVRAWLSRLGHLKRTHSPSPNRLPGGQPTVRPPLRPAVSAMGRPRGDAADVQHAPEAARLRRPDHRRLPRHTGPGLCRRLAGDGTGGRPLALGGEGAGHLRLALWHRSLVAGEYTRSVPGVRGDAVLLDGVRADDPAGHDCDVHAPAGPRATV